MSLADRLKPCGPVLATAEAARLHAFLAARADLEAGNRLAMAWPALAPAFAASAHLSALARRDPQVLFDLLAHEPEETLSAILAATAAAADLEDAAKAGAALRQQKRALHLLTALADLGGAWDLDAVTRALTRFADTALSAALVVAASEEMASGRMLRLGTDPEGPVPGLFCIAMGKFGARELNYSSDIDFSVFYEPEVLPLASGVEPQGFAVRLTQALSRMMQDRTEEGYVFRVDLRLRPDPSATPAAVPVAAALDYYATLGQNWERAAFIKARACAGDLPRARAFLLQLQPFIWRRSLDYAAIADIHSIKRQIHVHKVDERLDPRGADVKLGRGGIREIEFYVQTQQLILGGRDESLRSPRTVDALESLAAAGHVTPAAAAQLREGYLALRALEHRAQMIADQQTHKLPESDKERRKIAALSGYPDLRSFDAWVRRLLTGVNRRYGELFAEDEDLSSRFGSLVFTGVEDDPETLETLKRMGFSDPPKVAETIRAWHHGRIPATRSERGRELFTRLAPRLLESAQATGAPDVAFRRFSEFFSGLNFGVQVQSLFLAQPRLMQLVVDVLTLAPRLAATLARRPGALDAMMDPGFFEPVRPEEVAAAIEAMVDPAQDFEARMDAARRAYREQAFRIGVQLMAGLARADEAGPAFTALADACIRTLAPAALAENERLGGRLEGDVAVLALGKLGSGEMTATSDLDLMVVYRPGREGAVSELKGWWAETFYGRFTHRLVAALSAPTGQGGLYEVDLKLRPHGQDGPVAVPLSAFGAYYAGEAETWELMALTRARVVWSTGDAFSRELGAIIEGLLRRRRDRAAVATDVLEMRALMERERAPAGFWDLKLSPGGLVDIEFAAQHLQLTRAAEGGPLRRHTGDALAAFAGAESIDADAIKALEAAWRLQQDLIQVLRVALEGDSDPSTEPKGFRSLLARTGDARDFRGLTAKLRSARTAARGAYESVVR